MELNVREAQTKVVDIWLADEVLNAVWAVASKFRFRLASKAPNVMSRDRLVSQTTVLCAIFSSCVQ